MRKPLTQKRIEQEKRDLYFKESILNAFQAEGQRLVRETEGFRANGIHPARETRDELWRRLNRARRIAKIKRRTVLAARRACYCLLAFFVAGGVVITAVPPVRATVAQFLTRLDTAGPNIAINFEGERADAYQNLAGIHFPQYLPEGDSFKNASTLDDVTQVEFSSEENESLFFLQQRHKAAGQADGENLDDAMEVMVGSRPGYYTEKDGAALLLWDDGTYLYTLQGTIPKEELIEVGESVLVE